MSHVPGESEVVNPPAAESGPKRGRPRAEPVEVQRRRVLDVARAVIVGEGYAALTVTGVAHDAAVSRGTVHELFGDKAKLALAVIDDVLADLISAVDAHYEFNDPDEPLDEMVRRQVRWFIGALTSDPSIMVCLDLGRWLGSEAEDEVSRARARIETHISDVHRQRMKVFGVDRDPSARLVAVCVTAAVEFAAQRTVREGWDLEAATELVADFIVGGYFWLETPPSVVIQRFDEAPHATSTST